MLADQFTSDDQGQFLSGINTPRPGSRPEGVSPEKPRSHTPDTAMTRPDLLTLLRDENEQEGGPKTRRFERVRDIENSYHLEMVAQTNSELAFYYAATLRSQSRLSALTLRNFTGMFSTSNLMDDDSMSMSMSMPSPIASDMMRLLDGAISPLIQNAELSAAADGSLTALQNLPASITETCERFAAQLLRRQKTLTGIAEAMRRTYDPSALPLRKEAETWLISGMRRTGMDRQHDFADAMRLLRVCVENPFGMQDYIAWFQIGWLLWKHENLAAAEEAFYRAQRLSALKPDLYHVKSVLHLAYMQYLQGRYEDAYQTVQKAVIVKADYETMFDAARYAARTGRRHEALDYLERCIRERPTTLIAMFSEIDFQSPGEVSVMTSDMASLAVQMQTEARDHARVVVDHWQQTLADVQEIQQIADTTFLLPPHLGVGVTEARETVAGADYFTALEWEKKSETYSDQILRLVRSKLVEDTKLRRQNILKAKEAITVELDAHHKMVHQALEEKQDKIEDIPSWIGSTPQASKAANLVILASGIGLEVLFRGPLAAYLQNPRSVFSSGFIGTDLYYLYLAGSWLLFTYLLFLVFHSMDTMTRRMRIKALEETFDYTMNEAEAGAQMRLTALQNGVHQAEEAQKRSEAALELLADKQG